MLITNFARPDLTDPAQLERHSWLVASYLYPKGFLDDERGGFDDGAQAYGFQLDDPDDPAQSFVHHVKDNFDHLYGTFITRHIVDIACLISPLVRLAGSDFGKVLFSTGIGQAASAATKSLRLAPWLYDETVPVAPGDAAFDFGGQAIMEPARHSLLWTMAACGFIEAGPEIPLPPNKAKPFLDSWRTHLKGDARAGSDLSEIIAAYYGWRDDPSAWSDAFRKLAEYPYGARMPFLCDAPTIEVGFYPAISQLAFPTHLNVREARRYTYRAEGRATTMFLDVLPFDECRYVYDWPSSLHLVPGDWDDVSHQLTFRFALDGIAKAARWYHEDFLFGCNVVGLGRGLDPPELRRRRKVSAPRVTWRPETREASLDP